ncbi:PP2C family protein-serine/threonine phosphatase [Marinobacter salexigens]|uniref:Protein phosphatase 2C domain-containing protein n=1 Tax=Marinobacter salexigens TaxID=1925763 RepID=A0ABS6A787_9GAMM|nr:protein phosphatase 2C domain-containing protein [Marinobacter salexigens]MBU2873113.1 protein phosphatase 2C domain-containing protein [Marinobacter salexigens]
MRYSSAQFTHTGAVRDHNEDAYLSFPEDGLWVVADGMGGHQAGEVASQLICDTVSLERQRSGSSMSASDLEKAIYLANQRIRKYGDEQLPGATLGSTMVALKITDDRYKILWIGDSRAYLLRESKLQRLSKDHSQVADLVEQGVLSEEEAESHPLANVITRALGVEAEPLIDSVEGKVMPGDRFLLCTDGISREFEREELEQFLMEEPIEDINQALRHAALVKECRDNITSIIVQVEPPVELAGLADSARDSTLPLGQWNL